MRPRTNLNRNNWPPDLKLHTAGVSTAHATHGLGMDSPSPGREPPFSSKLKKKNHLGLNGWMFCFRTCPPSKTKRWKSINVQHWGWGHSCKTQGVGGVWGGMERQAGGGSF